MQQILNRIEYHDLHLRELVLQKGTFPHLSGTGNKDYLEMLPKTLQPLFSVSGSVVHPLSPLLRKMSGLRIPVNLTIQNYLHIYHC